jgi:ring-1,2-phenylacetyl-CoA epoxidase subunit PaaD
MSSPAVTGEELREDGCRAQYSRQTRYSASGRGNLDAAWSIKGAMARTAILGRSDPSGKEGAIEGSGTPSLQELERARAVAAAVVDPEIPVLTLEDLGVLRGVEAHAGRVVVKLTPTYTGCPATLAIRLAVETALAEAGFSDARVETVLSPPWSTDQITEEGRRKLAAFGIAPPQHAPSARALFVDQKISCPKCGSTQTRRISEFGATACKALWRCESCAEPFDYFKCI